jgi:hypothetical protein
MATLDEIRERIAERRRLAKEKQEAQFAIDLEAYDNLCVELGDSAVVKTDVERYVDGLPTLVVHRLPTPAEAKRFQQRTVGVNGKPGDQVGAANELAESCLKYPDRETYKKICEAFTQINTAAANAAIKASEGKAVEEGKL